ncbi:MAG: GGDEF domain-containing protein [Acidobacteriota bacterium]
MISLRKHIDDYRKTGEALSDASLAALRCALHAMGDCGQRAIPSLGTALGKNLAGISQELAFASTPDALRTATARVHAELGQWAERALQHHNENEREIREILGAVARAAETIGKKDEKYSREIGDLSGRMRSIAELKDLAAIRRHLIESAALLKDCVEKMAAEGTASLRRLTAEVAEYRARLEDSERVASLDELTQLANRRAFERMLEARLAMREGFCLILIDLDDFKSVNDRHGHAAGDELLRQFATELRGHFQAADTVCRWGGDEFSIIVSGDLKEAGGRAERIRRWVLGEYKLTAGAQIVNVVAEASLGIVEWNGKETGVELLARADAGLYQDKSSKELQRCGGKPVSV